MQAEKSPIKISIGTAEFEFKTIAETVAFLRGHEHASPRRRRAKSVVVKTGAKPNA